MIFSFRPAGSVTAILVLGLALTGCAATPSSQQSASNRVSLGVQLVRVPDTATRSVTPSNVPAWQTSVGDPDDFEGDELEEIAEIVASDAPPVTKVVTRDHEIDSQSAVHDGDVDAESGGL